MHSKNTNYRPDIDGLRALAVILVLLFHFDLGVPGGFVGVDVFFVISGYLITEVIRNAIDAGRFSFFNFYARRLLRLHPALIVTVGGAMGAGFVLMDPAAFIGLADSAKYAIFSASNFYFWLNQGYFDASAQTQPLLHTWSLAAEWQFYVVWPIILWAALKVSEKFLALLLAVMTVGSLAASQIMLGYDSSAAYFMMPFRVFELSIGALLVFVSKRRLDSNVESVIAGSGIVLIVFSGFFLDSNSPFPGLRALIPCLGAAAFIYAGRSAVGALFRTRAMVATGLISYSVYLVHWPIAVFYKYYVFRSITLPEKLVLLAASFVLGTILYLSVERLFMGKWKHVKSVGLTAVAASVATLAYGSVQVIERSGITSRIPAEYLKFASDPVNFHTNNYGGYGYSLEPILGDAKGRLVGVMAGDSYALQYAKGIDNELKGKGLALSGVFRHGCILSKEYTRILNNVPRQDCKDAYAKALSKLEGNDLPFILAQSWSGYSNKIADHEGKNIERDGKREYSDVIEDILLRARIDIGDRPFFIVGSQPFLYEKINAVSCLLRPRYVAQGCEALLEFSLEESSSFQINKTLKRFASSYPNTFYIDAASALCRDGICKTVRDGKILYSDATHLSLEGSLISAKPMLDVILGKLE
ncbi:acyltransferase [Pseudomonas sp. Z3-6]|uniref:acyltransferase family protein n=1 Tax=Pseudomonas sp. Z3-6 TaxID=2817411 RepID=UPI003DA9BB09